MGHRGLTRRSLLGAAGGSLAALARAPRVLGARRRAPPPRGPRASRPGPPAEVARAGPRAARPRPATVALDESADLLALGWREPPMARPELRFQTPDGAWSPGSCAAPARPRGLRPAAAPGVLGEPLWTGGTRLVQLRSAHAVRGARLYAVDVSGGAGAARLAAAGSAAPARRRHGAAGRSRSSPPGRGSRRSSPASSGPRAAARRARRPPTGRWNSASCTTPTAPTATPAARCPRCCGRSTCSTAASAAGTTSATTSRSTASGASSRPAPGASTRRSSAPTPAATTPAPPAWRCSAPSPSRPISPAARASLEQLLSWKLSLHGVPALGRVMVTVDPAGAAYSRYPGGQRSVAAAHRRAPRRGLHRLPRRRPLRRAARDPRPRPRARRAPPCRPRSRPRRGAARHPHAARRHPAGGPAADAAGALGQPPRRSRGREPRGPGADQLRRAVDAARRAPPPRPRCGCGRCSPAPAPTGPRSPKRSPPAWPRRLPCPRRPLPARAGGPERRAAGALPRPPRGVPAARPPTRAAARSRARSGPCRGSVATSSVGLLLRGGPAGGRRR